MWTYSKKVGALLFGKHSLGDDPLCVVNRLDHPDGTHISWPGNDGLIFTLEKRLRAMEAEIEALKKK